MIYSPFEGAAFGEAGDGDGRRDPAARESISAQLGISVDWAYVNQVHGRDAVRVTVPGLAGDADAMFSSVPGLPMAIGTADCVPIVIGGPDVAAVIHAGWRGLDAGVIPATLDAIAGAGLTASRAAIGPAIGPCHYEVGPEVAERFPDVVSTTSAGTLSVDLPAFAGSEVDDILVHYGPECTICGGDFNSYRRDGTEQRQVTVAWVPGD